MKKLLFIALMVIWAQGIYAQDTVGTVIKKHHLITQSLSVATLFGNGDGDAQNSADYSASFGDVASDIEEQTLSCWGFNMEYTLHFVPGKQQEEGFKSNALGFAYGCGFVAAADKQDRLGYTFDLLLKIGAEFGFAHSMGVGIDILGGTGKSPGYYWDMTSDPVPYTSWCWKNGIQVWVRTGLLNTVIKNSDMSLFVRFVYSRQPSEYANSDDGYNFWQEESAQFGVRLVKRF